jgi:hypothetical protein
VRPARLFRPCVAAAIPRTLEAELAGTAFGGNASEFPFSVDQFRKAEREESAFFPYFPNTSGFLPCG